MKIYLIHNKNFLNQLINYPQSCSMQTFSVMTESSIYIRCFLWSFLDSGPARLLPLTSHTVYYIGRQQGLLFCVIVKKNS